MAVTIQYSYQRSGTDVVIAANYYQDAGTTVLLAREFRFPLLAGSTTLSAIRQQLADQAQAVEDALTRWQVIDAALAAGQGQRLTQAQIRG